MKNNKKNNKKIKATPSKKRTRKPDKIKDNISPKTSKKLGRFFSAKSSDNLTKKQELSRRAKKEIKKEKKEKREAKLLNFATKTDNIILNSIIIKNTRRIFAKIDIFIKKRFSRIKFVVTGLNVTKLLNVIKSRNIPLFEVEITPHGVNFIVKGNRLEKTCKILKSLGYDFTYEALSIPYKTMQLLSVKKAMFLTIICCFVFYLTSSFYLLNITINAEKEVVTKLLQSCGVKVGTSLKNINEKEIESYLLKNMDISFCDVRLTGNSLYVQITKSPEITPVAPDGSAVIIALEDCILSRQLVYSGTPTKKFGDVIKKGDVLIDNKLYVDENLFLPTLASGDVYGLIQKKSTVIIPKTRQEQVLSGKTKTITTLGYNKKFKQVKSPYKQSAKSEKIQPISSIIPIYKRTVTYKELTIKTVTYDENKVVSTVFKTEKEKLLSAAPLKAKISRTWFDLTDNGDSFTLTSYIEYEDKVSTLSSNKS